MVDYNELLEKANEVYKNCVTDAEKRRLESIFPELKVVLSESKIDENYKNQYVDLGLPSGTLWAKCNVGAENPWEYGNHCRFEKAYYMENVPSSINFQELINNCVFVRGKMHDVKGLYIIGKNKNSIFLPAAGQIYKDKFDNKITHGRYWSSSEYSGNMGEFNRDCYINGGGYYFYFNFSHTLKEIAVGDYFVKFSIRLIKKQ